MAKITRERAERIAKSHACENCGEYSYKKLVVKPALEEQRMAMGEVWHVVKVCGVCDMEHEMGLDVEGDILYVS